LTTPSSRKARWLRDFLRFVSLKSQFVLSGNVYDLQVHGESANELTPISLQGALARELYSAGYKNVLSLDLIRGLRPLTPAGGLGRGQEWNAKWSLPAIEPPQIIDPSYLALVLDRVTGDEDGPTALLVEYASRLIARNQSLTAQEHAVFSRAQILSLTSRPRPGPKGVAFFNTIVWIAEREVDLPDWFVLGNPRVRHISVAKPDHVTRRAIAPQLLQTLAGDSSAGEETKAQCVREFVESTEGLLIADLQAIINLARKESLTLERVLDAVRQYKVGVTEDQWAKIDRQKIRDAEPYIRSRVKGQPEAVARSLDVIKRAVTGVGGGKRGGRPRGVLFFAGPTGVGKTELAKTLTNLLFGDENAYIRFDMSEFSAEHSDQRLIGAPPGYVGYDAGGELTNAMREKPFSLVLFDEIEKAHPRILDKFLQILDDGVLTSGRGDRVYFSEAFIVFTSNLGIYRTGLNQQRTANVTPDDGVEAVRKKILEEIERYFKAELNRPEILNRIGDNIIVFDFIRADVAQEILDQMVRATLQEVEQSGIHVLLAVEAQTQLAKLCLDDLSNGGRGIRNKVETHLINPLSRALFDRNASSGSRWTIKNVSHDLVTSLDVAECT
jgi:ATP-dependent Clp protease ATP-binding subunit ClpA